MISALALLPVAAPLLPMQEPAALHAGDAAFVIQVPDIQRLMAEYRNTAMARMLADQDLHVSIGQLMGGSPDAAPIDPVQFLMGEYRSEVARGGIPPFLDMLGSLTSFSASIEVPGGDLLGFFNEMERRNRDEDAYAAANLGVRVVADFVSEEAAAQAGDFLRQMLSDEAPGEMLLQSRAVTLDGPGGFGSTSVQVWAFAPAEPGGEMDDFSDSIRILTGGHRLAITAGTVDGDEYLDVLAGGSIEASAADMFSASRKAFRKASNTPMMELYLKPFVERLVAAEEPDALPFLDVAEGLIGPMASMVIRGGHWRIGLQNGDFITEGICEPGADGPLAGLLGGQPLKASSLTLSHPDALVTSVTSLDPDVLSRFVVAIAAQEGEGMLDEIEQAYGFRPERLAGALGNAISYSLPTLKSLVTAPNLMGAAELRDRNAFIEGMDGLVAMAEDAADELTVQRKEYKGSMLYTVIFSPEMFDLPVDLPFDASSFFRPTITVMPDRVMFTTLPSHAQKEIRRIAKLAKSNEDPGVHAQITAMGDLAGATTVGYADWPQFFGNLYAQLRSLAPMIGNMMGGDELPIDVNALPEAEQLTRHFRPSERWTRRVDGRVLHYSKSSIGPETVSLPLLGAGLFGVRQAQAQAQWAEEDWVVQEWEEVELVAEPEVVLVEGPQREATRDILEDVAVAITLYQLDHKGQSPATLSELIAKTDLYPNGYLDSATVPNDAWGHTLVYTANGGEFQVRSVGADGVDDAGGGDDVVLD